MIEMMNLQSQLDAAKEHFIASAPLEFQTAMFRMIQEQQESGLVYGLPVGSKAKDFTLRNALGQKLNLFEELAKGPVVLSFYRGGWCPFCSMQLKAYQDVLSEIHKLGAQLIAISPQSPVAAKHNILFEVPTYVQEVLSLAGLNLAEYNSTDRWVLPVPTTFMIDESGVIRSTFVNPDFMKRPDSQDILDELRKL
jgi:peroxiredoxin